MEFHRKCVHDPSNFCFVCGKNIPSTTTKALINPESIHGKAYELYFNTTIQDHTKPWAPSHICQTCRKGLENWFNGAQKSMPFAIPRIWTEPEDHSKNCYFCSVKLPLVKNKNNLAKVVYPNISSSMAPVPHSSDLPIPIALNVFKESPPYSTDSSTASDASDWEGSTSAEPLTQRELNDLVRHLKLTKQSSEYLTSFLKTRKLVDQTCISSLHRNRHRNFSRFFTTFDALCFCFDINSLFQELNLVYTPAHWVLFMDASTYSLKAVLMHVDNAYPSLPLAHAVGMKETYDNIKLILEKLDYSSHQWLVCGDFKMISFLQGLQGGYTKYSCYLCLWDSRNYKDHYKISNWPPRCQNEVGSYNIHHENLVPADNILMPTLHIKLGVFKQFIKACNGGRAIEYLEDMFPKMTKIKIINGIFTGPQIRKIIHSTIFKEKLSLHERDAFQKMSDVFINCVKVNDQDGERFHQDILPLEKKYKGKWTENMMGDYLWNILEESKSMCKRQINTTQQT